MNHQQLYEWMKYPDRLNRDTLYELRTLLARYPYFQTVRLLYLKNLFLLHDISFGEELRRSALYVADRKMLFDLVEGDKYTRLNMDVQLESESESGLDRTLSLIDAFLSTLPEEDVKHESVLPFEITTDYTAYLFQDDHLTEQTEEAIKMQGQELIDTFLDYSEEKPVDADGKVEESLVAEQEIDETSILGENEEVLDDESYFTETLAKIYVKQQRYSKALEIIRKLNLNYPKKNAYFADQIRFLEKLIINAKSK